MLLFKLKEKLNNYRAGTFISVTWENDITSARARKENVLIFKESKCTVRTKINYKNLKANQGKEYSNSHSSWFEHTSDRGIVQSKSNPDKKYIQLFPLAGKNSHIVKAFVKGVPVKVSIEEAYKKGWVNKSALTDINEMSVLTISTDNIKYFGGNI